MSLGVFTRLAEVSPVAQGPSTLMPVTSVAVPFLAANKVSTTTTNVAWDHTYAVKERVRIVRYDGTGLTIDYIKPDDSCIYYHVPNSGAAILAVLPECTEDLVGQTYTLVIDNTSLGGVSVLTSSEDLVNCVPNVLGSIQLKSAIDPPFRFAYMAPHQIISIPKDVYLPV